MDVIDQIIVMQYLGLLFDGFAYFPVVETRGGILLAWDSTILDVDSLQMDDNFLMGMVRPKMGNGWWISVVYDPLGDELKTKFLLDLGARRSLCPGPWMVLRDFNMILRASEKRNTNLSRGMIKKIGGSLMIMSSRGSICTAEGLHGRMRGRLQP